MRDFFYQISGPQLDEELFASFVDDLVSLLANTDIIAVLADFGKRTRREDPVVHFYETFLAAYDPKLRELRGVYYTPEPIVSYIVRSVDHLLKTRFNCPDGIADTTKVQITNKNPGIKVKGKKEVRKTIENHRVLVLDPATGTATFLYSIVDLIRKQFMKRGDAGMWPGYVRQHLLPRLFGFEYLMAPYAVAHFKLALQLAGYDLPEEERQKWAYDFSSEERIKVFLTNSLEGPHEDTGLPLFTQFLAQETAAANQVKQDLPIMVVIGNPPYSGESANTSKWINDLVRGKLPDGSRSASYHEVDGATLGERNPKWLQNDYVKFIRFGQWRIEKTGAGILAFITDHGYLDNPTFRGMRQALQNTFSEIFVLDLHGDTTRKEFPPDGIVDKNVFDIKQGVSIGLFIKEPGKKVPGKIYHSELWGTRDVKYQYLQSEAVKSTEWKELSPKPPFYLFVPQYSDLNEEYYKGWSLPDIFPVNSMGIATARDNFTIHWKPSEVWETIEQFINLPVEDARERFNLGKDARDWKVTLAQDDIRQSGPNRDSITPITYRPFDVRYTYYTGKSRGFICMPRPEVMGHAKEPSNLSLCFIRRSREQSLSNFLAVKHLVDKTVLSSVDNANIAPLYLFGTNQKVQSGLQLFLGDDRWVPGAEGKVPNLNEEFIDELQKKFHLTFIPSRAGDLQTTFGPEDVFHYIYAILFSPTYRKRYSELLVKDFPRIPVTSDNTLFRSLCSLGRELVSLHLLESQKISRLVTRYPVPGNNLVEKTYPKYNDEEKRVYINKKQYFDGISSDVWEYQIGGYQVCEKWLKVRQNRQLTFDELMHFQKIVVCLRETIKIIDEVDNSISAWPLV